MPTPVSVRDLTAWLGTVGPFGPRPFYVVGRNPNTISDVQRVLRAGANAIEPDVNVYLFSPGELCISHDRGLPTAPPIAEFLRDLRGVASAHPELALVVFDCKVSDAALGEQLLDAVRVGLAGTGLNVVISVADLGMTSFFDRIAPRVGPASPDGPLAGLRTGLMIDEENDAAAVSSFFSSAGVFHQCFGNGISVLNDVLGPNVRPSVEYACARRAMYEDLKFVYAWTVNDSDLQREYIRIGVDGLITESVDQLAAIVPRFAGAVRLATRDDNPFQPANAAYALTVKTADVGMAGTDANVTFTLNGAQGSASATVDTKLIRRMERNETNYVTIQSPDLGDLRSVTVQRDDSGNAPDWNLAWVRVQSYRYAVDGVVAQFNRWIDDTRPVTQPLVPG